MTFEEWWEKTEKDEEIKNREVIYKNLAELLAHDAWKTAQKEQFKIDFESAQPKWTMCKDAMPDKTGNYLWLDNDRHVHIDHYWADMPLMPYVIAWMPFPEVPNVHDD